jgi:CHASE2 domain-containing sensor protein/predicted Ser/Thr protein kinase
MGLGKSNIWSSNWLIAAVYCVLFTLLAAFPLRDSLQDAESDLLTQAMNWTSKTPSSDLAIISIDQKSLDNVGPWPWQRSILAQVIGLLADSGARAIATTVRLDAPQNELGRYHLEQIRDRLQSSGVNRQNLRQSEDYLDQALAELNTDGGLAETIAAAGNVYLPMDFPSSGHSDRMSPDSPVQWSANSRSAQAPRAEFALQSLPEFAAVAAGNGHLYMPSDSDKVKRRFNLLVSSQGKLYPSLAALLVSGVNQDKKITASLNAQGKLQLNQLVIPVDDSLAAITYWYPRRGGKPAFPVDSFWDVFAGNTPADKFRDKVVLLGPTEKRIARRLNTPLGEGTAEIFALAHQVSTLMNQHFTERPGWVVQAERVTWFLVAIYLAFILTRLRPRISGLITLGSVAILLVTSMAIYVSREIWFQPLGPILMLLGGHLLMSIKRLDLFSRIRRGPPDEQVESDRMLGLAFQQQGQLDLAWDKFRTLPLDDAMMAILYSLALAYEAKRKLSRSRQIYDHMASYDADYRDLQQRMQMAQKMEDTITLGVPGASGRVPVWLTGGGQDKPRLGRYIVQEEIGKGAMGVVYLAVDPSLNRKVALKAIPLAEEFDEGVLEDVKKRFFREAEAAGRLDHPNIVGVYDAGEDNDLAYIAMEYMEGKRLSEFTSSNSRLADETILELGATVAEALHYAHARGVVHRDIKPSNLLYNAQTGKLKIADFGVARFDESNRTRTGLVLGTPSYMSPEQIEGENVTGASDLFSLGVTLYQLLTGYLPFRADSLAKLMYKIANEPHMAVHMVRDDLPDCIEQLIGKALAKKPLDRFNSGAEMAHVIRNCLNRMREERGASPKRT